MEWQIDKERRNTKLGDRLLLEKAEVSENVGMDQPKPAKLRQKKLVEKKVNDDDEEVVKYMSNLPSYLQRGKQVQGTAFNVGVLDWNNLERWQSKQKQVPSCSSGFSPSSSNNTSSFSPTEESSSNSSRADSCSPHRRVPTQMISASDKSCARTINDDSIKKIEARRRNFLNGSNPKEETSDKADSKDRSTTPLKRLLEPLLRSKRGSSDNVAVPSEGDSTSRDKNSKSAPYTMKVKLDLKNCKTIEFGDPCPVGRLGPSTKRALLQVAVKNGVPLFKFAVENEGDVVAATMKQSTSSSKDKNRWIYTFFTVQEMKKKDKIWSSHGYVPSVIAQMKTSDASSNQAINREFVLFNMDIKQADQQTAGDELAAIVVELSETREVSMNVILPGGNHGVPRKGQVSSLIERWRSGGSCDCGGWDLGCRLRTLTSPTKVHLSTGKFELFPQGDDQDNKPLFRLCPFKEGILSVEYSSSLETLQAISICLAVLNIQKQFGFCEPKNTIGQNSIPPLSPVGRV